MVSVRSLAASILLVASMAATLPPEDGGISINIAGGTTATISVFAYVVIYFSSFSLTDGGSHFCGGVLLNANTVLTAGHCSEGVRASAVKVRVGTATRASGGKQVGVSSIKIHSSYTVKDDIPYNDIAIWKLSSSISESSTIKYATLPVQGSDPSTSTSITVAGRVLLPKPAPVSSRPCERPLSPSSPALPAATNMAPRPSLTPYGALVSLLAGYASVYTWVGSFVNWINTNKA
ncbi:hypothetical protein V2G26_007669 [Clonostachys chloroleuca]